MSFVSYPHLILLTSGQTFSIFFLTKLPPSPPQHLCKRIQGPGAFGLRLIGPPTCAACSRRPDLRLDSRRSRPPRPPRRPAIGAPSPARRLPIARRRRPPIPDRRPPRPHRFDEHDGPVRGVHFGLLDRTASTSATGPSAESTSTLPSCSSSPEVTRSIPPRLARLVRDPSWLAALLRCCASAFLSIRIRSRSMTSAVVMKI